MLGSPVVGWLLQWAIQIYGAAFLPPMLAGAIGETASAVASRLLIPAVIQGLVLAMIGLLMVLAGTFLWRKERYILS